MDELLKMLNESGIRFLLVGGQAMRLAGMPETNQVPPQGSACRASHVSR